MVPEIRSSDIIPAGAIEAKKRFWKRSEGKFLFPQRALTHFPGVEQKPLTGLSLVPKSRKLLWHCKGTAKAESHSSRAKAQ